jgi:prepilin-type N-terminal cleavage/methylation domain-containing protein
MTEERKNRGPQRGFTLVELLIGATILVIGVVAMLGAVVSQVTLNEQARNLSWALNDANRVMERLRQQNTGSGCATPSAAAPTGFASWNVWLAAANGGGGKSIQPDPATNELIVLTTSGTDPLTMTVAVCWRHRNRVLGECSWAAGVLTPNEGLVVANETIAIDSPAMLSTVMTCRK